MIPNPVNRPWAREPVRDAVVGLAWFGVGLLMIWALPEAGIAWWGDQGAGASTASVLVLAAGCAAAVLRRSCAPAGLLVTAAALVVGPVWVGRTEIGSVLVFTDLLYCAVLYPPRRTARIVALASGAGVAVLALASLVFEGSRMAALSVFNLALVVGIPLVWGMEVRRHRDLAAAERARATEAERAAVREREAAVAAERARMARDLHDVVAGRLSAIALQSEAALQPGADPDLARRVLGTVRESGVAALGEMRTMIGLLRDGGPQDPPASPPRLSELDVLVGEAGRGGLDVRLDDDRGPAAPPAPVELAAYRIVQESLTNVAKHAPGARVRVHLDECGEPEGAERDLVVEVRNGPAGPGSAPGPRPAPGSAPDTALHGGTGLAGLRERARAVGGTLAAGPDGDGWRVRATLPLGSGGGVR